VRDRLAQALDWLDARTARERAFLLAAAVVALAGAWKLALWDPLTELRARASVELPLLDAQLPALRAQLDRLEQALSADPNAGARERQQALLAERAALDGRLAELTDGLIPPDEMAGVLRELVRAEPVLVRLEALAAEPVLVDDLPAAAAPVASDGVRPALFKHGVVIELRGDYLATLRYLESLESLPWRFFWDGLDYEVVDYPQARVRIQLHSLSLLEGFLGV
jgi:MSHA biogenesis protein MshJ